MTHNVERVPKRELRRLIRKSMKGDVAAFTELYGFFINTVYYNAGNQLYDKNDLDDVVQEVSIVLYKNLGQLKSPHVFYAYLYQTVRNICSNFNRKVHQQNVDIDSMESELLDDKNHTPDEALAAKELEGSVARLINMLPERQRDMLQMYYYHDLSYKEIAKITNVKIATVGSTINRAKSNMKTLLEDDNKQAEVQIGEQKFYGAGFDALIASAIAAGINSSLSKEKASYLLSECSQQIAEVATVAGGASAISTSAKAALASAVAVVVIGVGGVIALQELPLDEKPGTLATTKHESVFKPDIAQIDIVCKTSKNSIAVNPTGATLKLSEGVPQGWLITDSKGYIIATGKTAAIKTSVFTSLADGLYSIEWDIANDEGLTGTVTGIFEISS